MHGGMEQQPMDGLPRELGQQTPAAYDVERVRADFPILARRVHEKPGKPGRDG